MGLQLSDFDLFHRSVHGHDRAAFDWQKRLLEQIVERRCWPRTLDLPTGAGKTTCVDIALFALALDAQRPAAQRWCPRRIAMVVDRRVVVDQVAERGHKLAAALARPQSPVVASVASALRSLRADVDTKLEPVGVFTLRGGVPKDDGWARSPDQPLILASTVDQLGSRLLMQGYGVSRGMRPVHAGLLANDTLILLDEVHLSQPFAETLSALSALRNRSPQSNLVPMRSHVAFLSATPGAVEEDRFALCAEERSEGAPLGRRLHAHKPVSLAEVDGRDALERTCVKRALDLLAEHRVVAVVVNRVRSATEIADQLRDANVRVHLLTGRMRPLERDEVLRELRPQIETGRKRTETERLIVVGTQCIEAGADFDFDAMVSEGASLDALRQRFGRVDRLGEYAKKAEGVVIFDKSTKKEDPVYGAAAAATLAWLKTQLHKKTKTVDFGIAHMTLPDGEKLAELLAPKEHAPILLPAYLDLWMQSSQEPAAVPEASLWLHGPRSGPADVQVVWRADLTESLLETSQKSGTQVAAAVVAAVRPSALEAISLPFASAKAWLSGADAGDISDVEGASPSTQEPPNPGTTFLRWRGDQSEVCIGSKLRPGDTVIVPSTRGGVRHRCFDPNADEPVDDLAERAALLGRGQPVLRLQQAVLKQLGLTLPAEDAEDRAAIFDALADLACDASGLQKLWLEGLVRGRRRRPIVVDGLDSEPWIVLQGPKLQAAELRAAVDENTTHEDGIELTTDAEDSYCAGRAVPLAEHSADVERFARAYASALGLSEPLREDIALAAWLHDIGKADTRFQIMLRGGSHIEWLKDATLWAKSAMTPGDRAGQHRAQVRSGYPKGTRHEVQSLSMIEQNLEQVNPKAHDIDLVRFLVASHHGYCRPFAPPILDDNPALVHLERHESTTFGVLQLAPVTSDNRLYRLDSSLADRFWALVEKYGWFELCWLETILRLADHRASEEEQRVEGQS
jgi:CRISPR-associated endonuclease/helicase Cas3